MFNQMTRPIRLTALMKKSRRAYKSMRERVPDSFEELSEFVMPGETRDRLVSAKMRVNREINSLLRIKAGAERFNKDMGLGGAIRQESLIPAGEIQSAREMAIGQRYMKKAAEQGASLIPESAPVRRGRAA